MLHVTEENTARGDRVVKTCDRDGVAIQLGDQKAFPKRRCASFKLLRLQLSKEQQSHLGPWCTPYRGMPCPCCNRPGSHSQGGAHHLTFEELTNMSVRDKKERE